MPLITKEKINRAMKDLTNDARKIYGEKLKEVILFGSCARGDFDDESDVDVMILLDVSHEEVLIEERKMRSSLHNLDEKYEYDLLFAPIVLSYEHFNKYLTASPFYTNVKKEGIRYA